MGSAAGPDPEDAAPRHPTADNVIRTISPATNPGRYRTVAGRCLLVWSGGVLPMPVPMGTTLARTCGRGQASMTGASSRPRRLLNSATAPQLGQFVGELVLSVTLVIRAPL
jgi:hypothetical protein